MTEQPRILVLNQYYWPGVEATGQLLSQLCADLAGDYAVTVITGRLAAPRAEAGRAVHEGVDIVRVNSTAFPRRVLALRALNYLTYLSASARAAAAAPRPDVVLCMTDPPVVAVVALAAARRRERGDHRRAARRDPLVPEAGRPCGRDRRHHAAAPRG